MATKKAKEVEELEIKEEQIKEEQIKEKKTKKEEENQQVKVEKQPKNEEKQKSEEIPQDNENNLKKITDEKVNNILKKAKENGKITYGELAKELDNTNPEQIDQVFDAFEEIGLDVLNDELDDEEPDIEDLKEVEDLKLDEITDETSFEGINVDDPVRMYLREIINI